MNHATIDPNGMHLDGALLEALASGKAREEERVHAQEHLNECARCREELGAMCMENAGFSAFFRDEEAGMLRRAVAGNPASPRRVVFLALGAIAAAAVVIAATTMLSNLNGPVPKSRSNVAEENPGPKQPPVPQPVPTPNVPDPVKPPITVVTPKAPDGGGAVTYQGDTAEGWASFLTTPGRDEKTKEQARHALVRIGADAVPLLLKMMREGTPYEKDEAAKVLALLNDKSAVPEIIKLLSDPNWEVRLQAVQMLKPGVPDDERAVAALQKALLDRDKAVVEAAEEALLPLKQKQADRFARVQVLLAEGREQMKEANWAAAIRCFQGALFLTPDLAEAKIALDQAMAARDKAAAKSEPAPDPAAKPETSNEANLKLLKLKLQRNFEEMKRLTATLALQEAQLKSDTEGVDRGTKLFENGAMGQEGLSELKDKQRCAEKALVQTKADLKQCELDAEILRVEIQKLQVRNP